MENSTKLALKEAIELIRTGKRQEAAGKIAELLNQNPKNEMAWFVLSHAMEAVDKKIYALKQVLAINPDHEKAQTQLAALQGKPVTTNQSEIVKPKPDIPQDKPIQTKTPEETPSFIDDDERKKREKSKFQRALPGIVFGGVILCLVVLAIAYFTMPNLFGGDAAASQPETSKTPPTNQPSPSKTINPGLPPTWTPKPTSTPYPTKQPSETPLPTLTSTPFPLNPETLNEIDQIQREVAVLMDLPLAENVVNEIMPKLKLKLLIYDLFLTEEYLASLEDESRVLAALGFVEPGYDLSDDAANGIVDWIGGFYLPEENKIHIIGTGFHGIEKYIYAHEYVHALQDFHHDLGNLGVYPVCLKPAQNCMAIRALVEGEADFVQNTWLETFPPEFEYNDLHYFDPPPNLFNSDDGPPPPYFGMESTFPYYEGYDFVNYLYQLNGLDSINQAYNNLPTTTEQILHPEKYLSGETGIAVNDPVLSDALGSGWRLLIIETLGEWETFLLLGYGREEDAQRPDEEAYPAAAGWGGDTYQVYYNDENDQILLTVHWVWETSEDAVEFYNSLNASLSGRFKNASIDGPGNGKCWLFEEQFSCIYIRANDILWLLTPTLDLLETTKSLYPQFP